MPDRSLYHSPSENVPEKASIQAKEALRGLIVEDEATIVLLLQRVLAGVGYQIIGEACNGQEGIRLARETQPDFIVMDIVMPGIDGLQATRCIMEERPVPIVIMTIHDNLKDRIAAREAGASGYVVKPFTMGEVGKAILDAITLFEEGRKLSLATSPHQDLSMALRINLLPNVVTSQCAACKETKRLVAKVYEDGKPSDMLLICYSCFRLDDLTLITALWH